MNRKLRCLLVLAFLLAASLACTMPIQLETPFPASPTAAGAEEDIPSITPPTLAAGASAPPPSPTPLPSETTPSPSVTSVPPTATPTFTLTSLPTATLTFTPTSSPTAKVTRTSSSTTVPNSPTPPPTLTPEPKPSRTATVKTTPPARAVFSAVYFSSPPKLDGLWDEWRDSTGEYPARHIIYGSANWEGPDDLDASFRVAWDESYLYLAVKVRDDVYVQNASEASLYLGDSLEVLLDRNLFGDLYTAALSSDDYQLGISPGRPDVTGAREAYLWFPREAAGVRAKVKIASVRQEGVTRVEAAVPWSIFDISPEAGDRFGFAMSVSDNDNPSENIQQSMISSAAHRVLVDPTTWGELRLK